MKLTGQMYGIDAAINFEYLENKFRKKENVSKWEENLFIRGELSLAFGKVDYTSKNTGTIDDEDNSRFEIRMLLGHKNFLINNLDYYAGFGYRKLVNDAENMITTTGHYGYKRTSRYAYIPLGLRARIGSSKKFKIEALAEYDFFLRGKQESDLTYLGSYKSEKDQNDGYGARGSVKFIIPTGDKKEFIVEPFVNYWDIDDSNPDQYGLLYEPKNTSLEVGMKFSISLY